MKATVSRHAHFNAAHRLFRKDWSDEQNAAVFGKCSHKNYHGHNYALIVNVRGEIDETTGFVMDMKVLADIIRDEVEEELDHKNLNLDVPEFAEKNPTAENMAVYIWNKLRSKLDETLELEVQLFETPRNSVTYNGK